MIQIPPAPTTAERLPPVPRRLAWLHFANDFTLDFLSPLLPGAVPVAWLGLMEGVADGLAQVLKLATGRASDASGKRVAWVRAGYATNAVMRPLAALGLFASLPLWIVACRIGDRFGKGLRGSASDALVADWTTGAQRARAFASMRTMDHLGATVGALVAAAAVWRWHQPEQIAWLIAGLALPATAMLWLCGGLADAPRATIKAAPAGWWPRDPGLRAPLTVLGLAALGSKIGPLLVLALVAGFGHDGAGAWPAWQVCLAWAAFGLVQTGAAALAGGLTVRLGPRAVLIGGWSIGAALFVALALLQGPALLAAGLGYGALSGATEGAEKTYLSALAPTHERALAFGALGVVVAAATVAGNSLCGHGLAVIGAPVFLAPAALLALAALALGLLRQPPGAGAE